MTSHLSFTALSLVALLSTLTACSDSSDRPPSGGGPVEPPPISVETPNADRCEILDSQNCMFPWPSSAFTVADDATVTGRRINMAIESMPVNKQGVSVDPAEYNRNDGFSPSQMILTQVPGLDVDQTGVPPLGDLEQSLDAGSPVVVIRASTGEQHMVYGELDANTDDPEDQVFIVRPMVQFERNERYIVALRNLKDADGELLEAPEVFRTFRDDTLTDNDAIEGRRDEMEDIFSILDDAGIAREELYLAWDFNTASVEDITGRVLHIRDESFAELGNAAPEFAVNDVVDFQPCTEEECLEGQSDEIAREIIGTFQVPNYLNSDDGGPGSVFFYDTPDDGLPDRMGGDNLLTANFICRIPRSVAEDFEQPPKTPARPSLYGHGLLGNAEDELREDHVDSMANNHQMMFCATDWIGFSSDDTGFIVGALQEWSLMHAFFDRQQQSFLNFMYLARLMVLEEGLLSDPAFRAGGEPIFDNSTLVYDSNSMGGIMGGGLMGVIQDVTRGALGVPGMSFTFILRRSSNWTTYSIFMSGSGTGDDGGGYASVKDQSFLLSMSQMLWDRSESSGYAYHINNHMLPNTPRHEVLLQVGYGDHQVTMWAAEMFARSIGARLRVPAVEEGRHPDENPYFGLEPVPDSEYQGSAISIWDNGPIGGGSNQGGTAPPPSTNTGPSEPEYGVNTHQLPRREPAAQLQKSEFLMPDEMSKFVDTCDVNLPCTMDGYVSGGG